MRNQRTLQIVLTIGLFPLWLLGVYAGLLLGFEIDFLVPYVPHWKQPPEGSQVIDIRVSESRRMYRCAALALTNDHHIYLYTLSNSGNRATAIMDVTNDFQVNGLPPAFLVKTVNPLEIEFPNDSQGVSEVQPTRLARLPQGEILASGHCYVWYEMWSESLDAAVVKDSGLWIIWSGSDDEPNRFFNQILLAVCSSAIVMTGVVVFLYCRIWHTKAKDRAA